MPVMEGAGVRLNRVFGHNDIPDFDPFLLLDDFRSDNPEDYRRGFPWHPHRGIETITYILRGKVEHGDSLGNKGVIGDGEVQWMTAGSGIIHQEMPQVLEDGILYGFQLWANLPASHKMMPPRYREINSAEIPEIKNENGVKIKIIGGEYQGIKGAVTDIITEPVFLDISIPEHKQYLVTTEKNHNVFCYVIDGEGYFSNNGNDGQENQNSLASNRNLVLFEEGDTVEIFTNKSALRFLMISGNPIKEPIAWGGPIVMNTKEELNLAFDEFEKGTFIK